MPPTTARLLAALWIATFAGCVDDTDELPPDDMTSAACVLPPTPPPYNQLWILTNARAATFSDYGTTECSAFTLAVRNADDVFGSFTQDSTAAACEETRFDHRLYVKRNGTWSLHDSDSNRGHWNPDSSVCYQLGSAVPNIGPNEEIRIRASARRTSCAGLACATTYGLPIRLVTDAD